MAPVAAALVDRAQVEQFPGMPEPAVLRRHSAGGETVVSHGRRVVFRYADADTAMRNLAVVALSDAGVPGVEVAATFGLSQKYLCRLRGQASRYVAAGLVVRRGRPPKLSAWEGALVRRWAGEGATQTEVAARCKVARSVISQLLDRLQPLPVQETLNPHRTLSLPVLRSGAEATGTDAAAKGAVTSGAEATRTDAAGPGAAGAGVPGVCLPAPVWLPSCDPLVQG